MAGLARTMPQGQFERWTDLAADAAEANCFYAPDMLVPALAHLVDDGAIRLIEAFDGPTLIGLMPVAMASRHGRLPLVNITNWIHRHCFFGAPLIRRGAEQAAWSGFFAQMDAMPGGGHFLHLSGIDAAGANAAAIEAVCFAQGRPFVEIQRYDRALLRTDLSADAYWETHVRAKKRKEIRRLQKRLAELGTVESRMLGSAADLLQWSDDFLALEASGWKGAEATALACKPGDTAFFHEAVAAAFVAGNLHFLRIDLDGRAIAMLVNFRQGDGAFSFKIAFDETLGRFSPGVLIEIDNLHAVRSDPSIAWMDSCAAAGHPMIDSLWAERRAIAQYRIALNAGSLSHARRALAFAAAGAAERIATAMKRS
jgi:CelD/BcsL family acetyltransferase involved in cellulose biosynthesis